MPAKVNLKMYDNPKSKICLAYVPVRIPNVQGPFELATHNYDKFDFMLI